jgi:hypothetical protein
VQVDFAARALKDLTAKQVDFVVRGLEAIVVFVVVEDGFQNPERNAVGESYLVPYMSYFLL